MKAIFLLLITFFLVGLISAQKKGDIPETTYEKAEVILENGSTLDGFVRLDKLLKKDPDFWDVYRFYYNQNYVNLFFKENLDENDKVFPIGEVKSVRLLDENGDELEFLEKANIYVIDRNLQPQNLNRTALLPLFATGKINLYGFQIIECDKKVKDDCRLSYFMPYIKKRDENIAYFPLDTDSNGNNIKTKQKIFDQTITHIAEKCPKFQEYYQKEHIDKSPKERRRKAWADADGEIGKMISLNKIPNMKTRNLLSSNLSLKSYTRPYLELMNKYDELCEN